MKKIKFTQQQFLENCKKVHGDKYDYSKSLYINCSTPVIIICKIHGEFSQLPLKHCNAKNGCPKCAGNLTKTTEQIIQEFKKIHGDKYDYSSVKYLNTHAKVKIICPKHGEFEQSSHNHLKGFGCKMCSGVKTLTNEDFIVKAKNIHGDKYDYSKTAYKSSFQKVIIICPIHGEFIQVARNHTYKEYGCPKCKLSKGELKIMNFLVENNIDYVSQKKFKDCRNIYLLSFDFYLPKLNICIEFDGEQHFEKKDYFGGKLGFEGGKKRDKIKNEYCKAKNIKLIRIKYTENVISKLKKELF